VEAKGSSPKRSSRWRTVNPDGTQHSCHLRRTVLRPNRLTRAQADATTIDLAPDLEPIDLTRQLASTRPYHPFRRYDGYDSQLHRSQSRHGSW
jgi:hypothetical protein